MLIWKIVLIARYTRKTKTLTLSSRCSQSSRGDRHNSNDIDILCGKYSGRGVCGFYGITRDVPGMMR